MTAEAQQQHRIALCLRLDCGLCAIPLTLMELSPGAEKVSATAATRER